MLWWDSHLAGFRVVWLDPTLNSMLEGLNGRKIIITHNSRCILDGTRQLLNAMGHTIFGRECQDCEVVMPEFQSVRDTSALCVL